MSCRNKYVNITVLKGQTITDVIGLEKESEEVFIKTKEGNHYKLYHEQDCCENIWLEDYEGEPEDIIGGLVVNAEEVTESGNDNYGTFTWTFYKIDTTKGSLWMRWLGESNGYYSESVDMIDLNK